MFHSLYFQIDDEAGHSVEETPLEDNDESWLHLVNKRSNSVNDDSFYDLGNLDDNNIAFVDDNDEIEDGNWFYRSVHRLKRSVSDLITPGTKKVRKSKKNRHKKNVKPLESSEILVHSKANKKSKKNHEERLISKKIKSNPSHLSKRKLRQSDDYDDDDDYEQSGDKSGSGDDKDASGDDMDDLEEPATTKPKPVNPNVVKYYCKFFRE